MSIRWPRTAVGWWRLGLLAAAVAFALAIILQPPPWKVFAEAGDKMRVVDYVVAWSWIAAAVNILILLALGVLCPWWANAPRPAPVAEISRQKLTPRWFWPAVLAAVVAGAALSGPRLAQSLWDDEETSLRCYILGRYKHDKADGHLHFKEVGWRDTFFAYDTPNNHILNSVLARLANSAWRAVAKPCGLQFREWALRLPAFLAGLASIAAVALLLKDVGMPFAGALGAWVLALHPWFNKYCAEARAYTMSMLFTCLAVFFWRRAIVSGGWLWWGLFALAQTLCLWAWPGALTFFTLLNIGTLAIIARGRGLALPRRTVLSRWFCCNALAGVAMVQMMLPLVPQMTAYLEQAPQVKHSPAWLADTGCYLATGLPWAAGQTPSDNRPEIRSAAKASPSLHMLALIAGTVLLAWGIATVAHVGKGTAWVVVLAVAGSLLQLLAEEEAQLFVFAWYTVFLLPLLAGAFAAGLAALSASLQRWPFGKIAAPSAVLAVFALFLFVSQPARARGLAHSTEPVRESVLLTRPDLDPSSPRNAETMTVGITDPPFIYDPNLFWARSTRDLLLLCLQADASRRPLRLNLGHLWLIRENVPLTRQIIDDPAFFTEHRVLLSEFPHCDRMVCRYVPGSATRADLSKYLSPEDVRHVRENAGVAPEKYFAK